MKKLEPDETSLVGQWVFDGTEVKEDETCRRIHWLVSNVFDEVAVSEQYGAWETLFRDSSDGRYWERTYPQSEMHGGGPPALNCVSEHYAQQKYKIS